MIFYEGKQKTYDGTYLTRQVDLESPVLKEKDRKNSLKTQVYRFIMNYVFIACTTSIERQVCPGRLTFDLN